MKKSYISKKSLFLCLCISSPSSLSPVPLNTLPRKSLGVPCQLGFFDFSRQKHAHSSKHEAERIAGARWNGSHKWFPTAGTVMLRQRSCSHSIGSVSLPVFPSDKGRISLHRIHLCLYMWQSCYHGRYLIVEIFQIFFYFYYWWILKCFLACMTRDTDDGIHIHVLFVSLCVC